MRKVNGQMNSHSRKGTTLVELVVAMTLTAIFAVVCVALINPIEKTYQKTEKLARAELLADTIIDSIRKECDDVKNDDSTSVWIAKGDFSSESVNDNVLFGGPNGTVGKADDEKGGPILIIKKNNSYCEAIYSCLTISEQNKEDAHANAIDSTYSGHAVDKLFDGGTANLGQGVVHFGYYQAKDDGNGVYPLKSYDYTNPVMAGTYDGFYVKLKFTDLTSRKEDKFGNGEITFPSFVMCTVEVYEGKYDPSDSAKGLVYSRSSAISFSANGSAPGGSYQKPDPVYKDVKVTVIWDDNDNAQNKRPEKVEVTLSYGDKTVSREIATDKNPNSITFANIDTTSYTVVQKTLDGKDKVDGYEMPQIVWNTQRTEVVITNKINYIPPVKLISGRKFKDTIGTNVTGVVFCSEEESKQWVSSGASYTKVSVDFNAANDDNRTDDYKLYKVGTMVYVVSADGKFVANENCASMFENCSKLIQITGLDGDHVDTSNTTTMYRMFYKCSGMTQFNVAGLVKSKCENTEGMFEGCTKATLITFTDWNTSGVTTMNRMFYNLGAWATSDFEIDISELDFDSCKIMSKMFYQDIKSDNLIQTHITKIKFPYAANFKTVTTAVGVFTNCEKLTEVENFRAINFESLEDCEHMFYHNYARTEIDLSGFKMPKCDHIYGLFEGCSNVTTIKMNNVVLSSLSHTYDTTKYKNKPCDNVFKDCSKLSTIEMEGIDLSSLTDIKFVSIGTLRTLKMKDSTLGVTSFVEMFKSKQINSVDFSGAHIDSCTTAANMFRDCSNLEKADFSNTSFDSCTSFTYMFYNCKKLKDIKFGILKLETAGEDFSINCSYMFKDCQIVKNFDFSGWDTSYVNTMEGMFYNCYALQGIDFSQWESWSTSNVTNMKDMFHNCGYNSNASVSEGIYTINISNFDFSNVESFYEMFNCDNNPRDLIKEIVLPEGDNAVSKASSVTAYRMFRNRKNLKTIVNLDQFNVTNSMSSASSMFANTGLTEIDISSLDLGKITGSTQYMFNDNKSLTVIYVNPDVDYVAFSEKFKYVEMFKNCSVDLAGQNGTHWSSSYIKGEYARIDVPEKSGYFSVKTTEPEDTDP